MARINIEDDIYKDPRFADLVKKSGSMDCAIGALVRVWTVAQKYYLDGGIIPLDEWKKYRLNEAVIEVGLAEKRLNGVWARGAKEQFEWLLIARTSGQKGGKKTAENKKKRKKNQDVEATLQGLQGSGRVLKALTLTLTLPLPLALAQVQMGPKNRPRLKESKM